jgi:TPR repeat protein
MTYKEEVNNEINNIINKYNYEVMIKQLKEKISSLKINRKFSKTEIDINKINKMLNRYNEKLEGMLKKPHEYKRSLQTKIENFERRLYLAFSGEAQSQYQVALDYVNTFKLLQRKEKAFYWAKKSAEQGHGKAMVLVGTFYIKGIGNSINIYQGISWYRKAAEAGHKGAPFKLGNFYFKGNNIKQDYQKAVYWYKYGNERKGKEILYKLGAVYEFGLDFKINYEEALYWYQQSNEQNHPKASEAIDRVRRKKTLNKSELKINNEYNSTQKYTTITRNTRKRNQGIVQYLKGLYKDTCQVCGGKIDIGFGKGVSEVHHIRPLGRHNGPDNIENMIVLCPNHHAMFDRGAITIDLINEIVQHINPSDYLNGHQLKLDHFVKQEFVNYHNEHIYLGDVKVHSNTENFHNATIVKYGDTVIIKDERNDDEFKISTEDYINRHLMNDMQYNLISSKIGDIIFHNGYEYRITKIL